MMKETKIQLSQVNSMAKIVPLRKCIITNEKLPKSELIRIVKNKEGQIFIDESGKQNGHGIYLKKDNQTIMKAKTSKKFNHLFDTNVDDELFEQLLAIIK